VSGAVVRLWDAVAVQHAPPGRGRTASGRIPTWSQEYVRRHGNWCRRTDTRGTDRVAHRYARALDSRWPHPILGDSLADEVVGKIDYDFEALGVQTSVVCQAALRAKMLDDRVRAFVKRHPDAVVVDLGAGLDDRMQRVGPPPTVDWYNVDLAGVTALRDKLLPPSPQAHSVAVSLADEH